MSNGSEKLIEDLYEMIQEAFALPFGPDRCIIDRDKALVILDELRATLPSDLQQAKAIVDSRNEVMTSAKKEAEATRRQAEDRARQMISQEEVLQAARVRANEIVTSAEQKARDVRKVATTYLDDALKKAEETIAASLADVRKTRGELRQAANKSPSHES